MCPFSGQPMVRSLCRIMSWLKQLFVGVGLVHRKTVQLLITLTERYLNVACPHCCIFIWLAFSLNEKTSYRRKQNVQWLLYFNRLNSKPRTIRAEPTKGLSVSTVRKTGLVDTTPLHLLNLSKFLIWHRWVPPSRNTGKIQIHGQFEVFWKSNENSHTCVKLHA